MLNSYKVTMLILITCAASFFWFGCQRSSLQVINISGSATLGEHLMPQLVRLFFESKGYQNITQIGDASVGATKHKMQYVVKIRPQGTRFGLDDMQKDTADIAMVSEKIPDDTLKAHNIEPENAIFIGTDRLIIIVHQHNPIDSLTWGQLIGVFNGRITDWGELSDEYKGYTINVHIRNKESGTAHTFRKIVMQKDTIADDAKEHYKNTELLDDVKRDYYGIGYFSAAELGKATDVKQVQLLGIPPDVVLERPLYLYYKDDKTDDFLAEMVSFLKSDQKKIQDVAKSMGFTIPEE